MFTIFFSPPKNKLKHGLVCPQNTFPLSFRPCAENRYVGTSAKNWCNYTLNFPRRFFTLLCTVDGQIWSEFMGKFTHNVWNKLMSNDSTMQRLSLWRKLLLLYLLPISLLLFEFSRTVLFEYLTNFAILLFLLCSFECAAGLAQKVTGFLEIGFVQSTSAIRSLISHCAH